MEDKMDYVVPELQAKSIRKLVESKKYRNPSDFLKNAIEILLTWESEHPEEVMAVMQSLMPFSSEQEIFMKQSMNPDERKKHFGDLEIDREVYELEKQTELAKTDDDHLKLRDNYQHTKKYIRKLPITIPENIIPYDGYPLLSGFYSRFLPVKLVISILGHLLEKNKDKDTKIELTDLRIYGYDMIEEISRDLNKYELENSISRNKKMSTGLPKKGEKTKEQEKIAMAQKRFKDQFIGKIRKNRLTKENHFEGSLSALGLVYAFEKDNKIFLSLTELGQELFLLDNPIIEDEYTNGSLSPKECEFILEKLIPQRKLEQKFIDSMKLIIQKFKQKDVTDKNYEKITPSLDAEIKKVAIDYLKKNPTALEKYNLNHLENNNDITSRKISQWRLATMGRLSELNVVNWKINEKGDSEYTLN